MTLQQKLDLLPQKCIIAKARHFYFLYLDQKDLVKAEIFCYSDSLHGMINLAIKNMLSSGEYPKMSPLTKEWLLSQL